LGIIPIGGDSWTISISDDPRIPEEPPSQHDVDRYLAHLARQSAAGRFTGPKAIQSILLELWRTFDQQEHERSERQFSRSNELLTGLTEEEGRSR
jgi:hypothetical protein